MSPCPWGEAGSALELGDVLHSCPPHLDGIPDPTSLRLDGGAFLPSYFEVNSSRSRSPTSGNGRWRAVSKDRDLDKQVKRADVGVQTSPVSMS